MRDFNVIVVFPSDHEAYDRSLSGDSLFGSFLAFSAIVEFDFSDFDPRI